MKVFMEILENRAEWERNYQDTWLAHFKKTGVKQWDIYNRPNNKTAPDSKAINLSQSKLMLVSSAGTYLPDSQERYDDENDLGDYTIRVIPSDVDPSKLAYAHTHYDHTAVNMDYQVLSPLGHMRDMVEAGKIGALTESFVSFMGYQPNAAQVVDETIPLIIDIAKAEQADAVLLVPS
jgi:D-proline reductase (dithiol) PrdB